MYIATWGNKGFTVSLEKIISFDDLEMTSSINTEKLDNEGKKPSTYKKGINLDTLTLKVTIDSNFGTTPEIQYNQWMDELKKQIPWPFLIKGKPLNNTKYLLTKVQPINNKYDNAGNWLTTTLYLEFEEFVAEGTPAAETNSTGPIATSSSPSNAPSTSSVYEVLKPKDKAALKIESKASRDYRTYKSPVIDFARTQLGG
jgi:hypothetical protein